MFKKILLVLILFVLTSQFSFAAISDVQTAFLQEDFKKAVSLAEQALSLESNQDAKKELRYYLALSHLRLNHFNEASLMFDHLSQEKLNAKLKDRVNLGLFDSYYLAGNYNHAYKIAKKRFKRKSSSEFLSLFYLKTARSCLKLAKWDEAKEFLSKVINEFPNSIEAQSAQRLLEEKQYFAVQVGAFIDQDRSSSIVRELKQRNEYAYIVETKDSKGRKFFRVRVGQFASLDEAKELSVRLSKMGYPTQIYP